MKWYYETNGEQHGPVTSKELKQLAESGELSLEDRVRPGEKAWRLAKNVKGLFSPENSAVLESSPPSRKPEKSLSQKVGEAGKAVALRTAKQADRTKLKSVSLPSAYTALGKQVLQNESLRDDLPELFAKADQLTTTIAGLEQHISTRTSGNKFTDKAKSLAMTTKDKAEIQTRRLQQLRLAAKAGQYVFENSRELGDPGLVGEIDKLLRRIAELDGEIANLSSKEPMREIAGGLLQNTFILATSTFVCFPIGLFLVWRNPTWERKRKLKWTAICLGIVGTMTTAGMIEQAQVRKEVAEAHSNWEQGDQQAAAAAYRKLTADGPNSIPSSDQSLVYSRLIDFEVKNGSQQSARVLVEAATGISLVCQSEDARYLIEEIASRQAALKRAKEAERAVKERAAAYSFSRGSYPDALEDMIENADSAYVLNLRQVNGKHSERTFFVVRTGNTGSLITLAEDSIDKEWVLQVQSEYFRDEEANRTTAMGLYGSENVRNFDLTTLEERQVIIYEGNENDSKYTKAASHTFTDPVTRRAERMTKNEQWIGKVERIK